MSKYSKEMLDIFRLPVYTFKFDQHAKYKEEWSKYVTEYPYSGKRKRSSFCSTTPNLHKTDLFNPLRVFFLECLYEVMSDIGFHCDLGLTSMWGTHHPEKGYHHSHAHFNSFFVGVYYLNSDTEETSGTVFENVLGDFMLTRPRPMKFAKVSTFYAHKYTCPFEEGKLIIFPAWLRHSTESNKGNMRQIIGFNAMPIGLTAGDEYDRYMYDDFRDKPMYGDDFDQIQNG